MSYILKPPLTPPPKEGNKNSPPSQGGAGGGFFFGFSFILSTIVRNIFEKTKCNQGKSLYLFLLIILELFNFIFFIIFMDNQLIIGLITLAIYMIGFFLNKKKGNPDENAPQTPEPMEKAEDSLQEILRKFQQDIKKEEQTKPIQAKNQQTKQNIILNAKQDAKKEVMRKMQEDKQSGKKKPKKQSEESVFGKKYVDYDLDYKGLTAEDKQAMKKFDAYAITTQKKNPILKLLSNKKSLKQVFIANEIFQRKF